MKIDDWKFFSALSALAAAALVAVFAARGFQAIRSNGLTGFDDPLKGLVRIAALAVLSALGLARPAVAAPPPAPTVSSFTSTLDTPRPSTAAYTVPGPPPFDRVQRGISDAFVGPIAWVDSFFLPEFAEIETNASYMRLIVGYDWENGNGSRFRKAVRLKVRVPGIKDKLHFIFFDDDEQDFERPARTRSGAITRPPVPITDSDDRRRAGLRYVLLEVLNTRVDVETALRSRARGEISLRMRQRIPVGLKERARFSVTGFWLEDTGFGSRGKLDIEEPLSDTVILRLENNVTQIHRVKGVVTENRISFDKQLSARAGISPGIGMAATTRPVFRAQAYRASVLYRQQFFREWLFYELEPGVNWSRDIYGAYPAVLTGSVRLEIQFRRSSP